MQRREPLGALREIAHALRNVSSIDREPNPDVLKARIELYQRDLEREIHRNRDAIGFPQCRLSAILPTLCDAMGEELRELTPTTRFLNTATGETGRRSKSLSDADRLAHLQAYGEWLSTIIERFAGSREELRDYESKPLAWLSNRRAGKYPTESSSAIHEVESGLTGIRFEIEGTQPQAALDARTEPQRLGPKGEWDFKHWYQWHKQNSEKRITQRRYIEDEKNLSDNPPDMEQGKKLFNQGWRLDANGNPYRDPDLARPKNRKKQTGTPEF